MKMVKKEFGVVLRGILRRREVREAGKREREMQDVGREIWLNTVEYCEERKASVTGQSAAVVRGDKASVVFQDSVG